MVCSHYHWDLLLVTQVPITRGIENQLKKLEDQGDSLTTEESRQLLSLSIDFSPMQLETHMKILEDISSELEQERRRLEEPLLQVETES